MTKEIIVATDFSPISLNAVYYAAALAADTANALLLLHVVPFSTMAATVPAPVDTLDITIDDARERILKLKEDLAQRENGRLAISVVVVAGAVVDELERLAVTRDTFAVVMGIRGQGASPKWLFGSQSIEALHRLIYPVFIIPEHAGYMKIEKMAMACDLHDVTDTIPTAQVNEFAALFGSSLDILYVQQFDGDDDPEMLPSSISLINNLSDVHPKFHFLKSEDVFAGIAAFINTHDIDLLFVVPKERSFIASLFHRSITSRIAANISIPLLVLHK